MSITAKQPEQKFDLVPAGNHLAICYQMIEIGTEQGSYMGQPKEKYTCRIVWELCNEKKVFDPAKGEQPYSLGNDYTLSMAENAHLKHLIDAWRGKALTEDEANKFDITVLLGKPCMLNVVHSVSKKNGKTYANVAGAAPVPKGMIVPPQVNPSFIFSYDEWDDKKFTSLPEWLRKRIEATPEFKARLYADIPPERPDETMDLKDDLPF